MANEIEVRVSVKARKGSLSYTQPHAGAFNITMTGNGIGPTPGLQFATPEGTLIDFSLLTDGAGIAWIQNQSTTANDYITYGVYDPESDKFYPLHDVYPGEGFPCRISQHLGEESGTAGTGTSGPTTNRMMVKSWNSASCPFLVDALPL